MFRALVTVGGGAAAQLMGTERLITIGRVMTAIGVGFLAVAADVVGVAVLIFQFGAAVQFAGALLVNVTRVTRVTGYNAFTGAVTIHVYTNEVVARQAI